VAAGSSFELPRRDDRVIRDEGKSDEKKPDLICFRAATSPSLQQLLEADVNRTSMELVGNEGQS
jgi:hypothetical protein